VLNGASSRNSRSIVSYSLVTHKQKHTQDTPSIFSLWLSIPLIKREIFEFFKFKAKFCKCSSCSAVCLSRSTYPWGRPTSSGIRGHSARSRQPRSTAHHLSVPVLIPNKKIYI
jgi:hypothetical protein